MRKNAVSDKKNKSSIIVVLITLTVLVAGTLLLVNMPDRGSVCKHWYTFFRTVTEPTAFTCGEKQKTCIKCKDVISQRVNAEVPLPQLYLDGDTQSISKTSTAVMKACYSDKDRQFDVYATAKYQGHTSLQFDKKNYTIKFYTDESLNEKYNVSFNGWDETSKYCLKANFIDHSGARNIVCANIWTDIVKSEENANENISSLPLRGAVDGFPVALFVNGEYAGLYTMNIPKDEDTYGIADEENEALVIINSSLSEAANFHSLLTEGDKDAVFEIEYVYPEKAEWPYEIMDELIGFVMTSDDELFREGLSGYLDTDTAIDYLIASYVLGLTDNFSKNMIFLTYDGTKMIPALYDMDTAFGLGFDGTYLNETDFSLPHINEDGTVSSETGNLLWDRVLTCFKDEFCVRYKELRSDILKNENIISRFEAFISEIPLECYEQDVLLYPAIPFSDIDHLQQISDFLNARTEKLDKIVAELTKGDN